MVYEAMENSDHKAFSECRNKINQQFSHLISKVLKDDWPDEIYSNISVLFQNSV